MLPTTDSQGTTGIPLGLCPLFLLLTPPPLTAKVMAALQYSILFLLYTLQVTVTNNTHHLRIFSLVTEAHSTYAGQTGRAIL